MEPRKYQQLNTAFGANFKYHQDYLHRAAHSEIINKNHQRQENQYNQLDNGNQDSLTLVKHKRELYRISIRKEKLTQEINAKRMKGTIGEKGAAEIKYQNMTLKEREDLLIERSNTFLEMIKVLTDNQLGGLHEILKTIRSIMSCDNIPLVEPVVRLGCVPILLHLVEVSDSFPDVQYEALWCIINIISVPEASNCAMIVKLGAIEKFIQLLRRTKMTDIQEVTIWGLANICGDDFKYRDKALEAGIIPPILAIIEDSTQKDLSFPLLKTIVWLISNLSNGKPYPPYAKVRVFLPFLAEIFLYTNDHDLLKDLLWSLAFLSDGVDQQIEEILEYNISDRVCELLHHQSQMIKSPALKVVANLLSGQDIHVQMMLDSGVISGLELLLSSRNPHHRKEACWSVSNILAGNYSQIQTVLESQILPKVLNIIREDDYRNKVEALFCFANAPVHATSEQVDYLVTRYHVIELLIEFIDSCEHTNLLRSMITGLDCILECGVKKMDENGGINPYMRRIEAIGGEKVIEKVQHYDDTDIYNRVYDLIERYFCVVTENPDPKPN